jgi:hypothetical protein
MFFNGGTLLPPKKTITGPIFLNPKILNNIHHAYKEHFDFIYIVI